MQQAAVAPTIEFSSYAQIREALYNEHLSRSFDKRSYVEGNHRAGILSILHAQEHKLRRRLENPLFNRENLVAYERELFPAVLDRVVPQLVEVGERDLFRIGMQLSVVLSARRAGIDHPETVADLRRLADYVETFSQGTAILDIVGDPEAVRERVRVALADLDERYVSASRARRKEILSAVEAGKQSPSDAPNDVLTRLLQHSDDEEYGFDDGVILRETATYLQAGTHTSAQTLVNSYDLLFEYFERHPQARARLSTDVRYAQRCVHEVLRLRPTTPRIKRLAEEDTEISGRAVARGSTVVLDVRRANLDPSLFGADPERFDPDRVVDEEVARWGLSFGAGAHICIGRTVAGGFPLTTDGAVRSERNHLCGLVALMLQHLTRAGITPDPAGRHDLDDRTDRGTRWRRYDICFPPIQRPQDTQSIEEEVEGP